MSEFNYIEYLRTNPLITENTKPTVELVGMGIGGGGGSITINDDNYQDSDVAISYMKDQWYVG